MPLPYFDAAAVRAALPFDAAIAAVEEALRGSVDPERDSPRLFSEAPDGEFLLMPTAGDPYSGVKVLTIAPDNPARGLEKIQGIYVLFDSDTLAPVAVLDGTELTAIRTPAVTLTAVAHLARAKAAAGAPLPAAPLVVVFGAGVQAEGHIHAARAVFPDARFAVIGKRPERVTSLVDRISAAGVPVRAGSIDGDVPHADVIVCVTSSPTPLFDGALPQDDAIIASVGQHGLDAREVDATLVLRSDVVVEGRASSWRESGDLAGARPIDEWREIAPRNLRELVLGGFTATPGRPALYTGVGMAWEDVVIASAVLRASTDTASAAAAGDGGS